MRLLQYRKVQRLLVLVATATASGLVFYKLPYWAADGITAWENRTRGYDKGYGNRRY
jgi:amino acid permease